MEKAAVDTAIQLGGQNDRVLMILLALMFLLSCAWLIRRNFNQIEKLMTDQTVEREKSAAERTAERVMMMADHEKSRKDYHDSMMLVTNQQNATNQQLILCITSNTHQTELTNAQSKECTQFLQKASTMMEGVNHELMKCRESRKA